VGGGVRVLVDSLLESVEVEVVLDELLVDLAEEEVVLQPAEPLDPPHVDVLAELRLLAHQSILLFELKIQIFHGIGLRGGVISGEGGWLWGRYYLSLVIFLVDDVGLGLWFHDFVLHLLLLVLLLVVLFLLLLGILAGLGLRLLFLALLLLPLVVLIVLVLVLESFVATAQVGL
jgi:hypothetical protein